MKSQYYIVASAVFVLFTTGCDLSEVFRLNPDAGPSKDASGRNICAENGFAACGNECETDRDCGEHLYCSTGKRCKAECTRDGDECGVDMVCSAHGRCMLFCANVAVDTSNLIPQVILLIDQSGSMSENFGGQSRWRAMRTALTDPTGVVPTMHTQIAFGASLYTSHSGFSGGACPILTSVAPALNNAAAITDLLEDNGPDQDTPTGESVAAVVANWPAGSLETRGQKVIVLATDGMPDSCEHPDDDGQAETIAAVTNAYQSGVWTYVLSVGDQVSQDHLQDVANVGAGLPVDGATNAEYFVANDSGQLIAAFDQIVSNVRSCSFALGETVAPSYADQGNVSLNDTPLVFEAEDGWRLLDGDTLELLGAACTTFLEDEQASLEATFPCNVIEG